MLSDSLQRKKWPRDVDSACGSALTLGVCAVIRLKYQTRQKSTRPARSLWLGWSPCKVQDMMHNQTKSLRNFQVSYGTCSNLCLNWMKFAQCTPGFRCPDPRVHDPKSLFISSLWTQGYHTCAPSPLVKVIWDTVCVDSGVVSEL